MRGILTLLPNGVVHIRTSLFQEQVPFFFSYRINFAGMTILNCTDANSRMKNWGFYLGFPKRHFNIRVMRRNMQSFRMKIDGRGKWL